MAPLPVKVAVPPGHMAVGFAEAITVGVGFTVKITVCGILLHAPLVPVTE